MNFKGKVALVTGASGGIGASTALLLAQFGCDVIIHYYQNKTKAEHIQKTIQEQYKVKTLLVQGDLSSETDINQIVYESIKTFQKIDILINNAGIDIESLFEEKDAQSFKKVMDINALGTFLLSKKIGIHMVQNRYGKIVNVSSNNALGKGCPLTLEYDASKAAILSLTHNLALQFAPYVNVNAIAPGWVKTSMTKIEDEEFQKVFEEEESKKVYLQRFAEPEEIANVIAFLVSDEASYVNDATIKVDGGYE